MPPVSHGFFRRHEKHILSSLHLTSGLLPAVCLLSSSSCCDVSF
jgi:hypothetical protein